jgi:ABC-2 type transport system permease protein
MKTGHPWLAMLRLCFLEGLQYRYAAIAGIATQVAFGLLFVFLYKALYASSHASTTMPLNWSETLSYLWLVQAFLAIVPWRGDPLIAETIMSGAVGSELLRPCSLYSLWFARCLGTTAAAVALRCLPIFLLAPCLFPLRMPSAGMTWLLFATSLFLAFLLSAALKNLLHVGLFWTVSAEGLPILFMAISSALSGQLVPLALLPDSIATTVRYLPFAGLLDTPISIFIEKQSGIDAFLRMGMQAFWIISLMVLSNWRLKTQLQRLSIAGG